MRRVAILVAEAAAAAILVSAFFFRIPQVTGRSMEPELRAGDRVLIDTLAYDFKVTAPVGSGRSLLDIPLRSISRGDVVAFMHGSGAGRQMFLKRVVGTAGDLVSFSRGIVFVNGRAFQAGSAALRGSRDLSSLRVSNRSLYLLGDNLAQSEDSRAFGPVPESAVIGRASLLVSPPRNVKIVF